MPSEAAATTSHSGLHREYSWEQKLLDIATALPPWEAAPRIGSPESSAVAAPPRWPVPAKVAQEVVAAQKLIREEERASAQDFVHKDTGFEVEEDDLMSELEDDE